MLISLRSVARPNNRGRAILSVSVFSAFQRPEERIQILEENCRFYLLKASIFRSIRIYSDEENYFIENIENMENIEI